MPTGINEIDEMVDGGRSVVSDVKANWRTKLIGLAVGMASGTVVHFTRISAPESTGHTMFLVGIGGIVVGVLLMLGVGGVQWIARQVYSAGKNAPKTKV